MNKENTECAGRKFINHRATKLNLQKEHKKEHRFENHDGIVIRPRKATSLNATMGQKQHTQQISSNAGYFWGESLSKMITEE